MKRAVVNNPDDGNALRICGLGLMTSAVVLFVLSFVACWLIQDDVLPTNFRLPEVAGVIAYFCGPLPIVPGILVMFGSSMLAFSALLKGTRGED
jgi:hypothetical protein